MSTIRPVITALLIAGPARIPVACVGVGAGRNAGLLAISILALSDEKLAASLSKFRKDQADGVAKKDANLQQKLKK